MGNDITYLRKDIARFRGGSTSATQRATYHARTYDMPKSVTDAVSSAQDVLFQGLNSSEVKHNTNTGSYYETTLGFVLNKTSINVIRIKRPLTRGRTGKFTPGGPWGVEVVATYQHNGKPRRKVYACGELPTQDTQGVLTPTEVSNLAISTGLEMSTYLPTYTQEQLKVGVPDALYCLGSLVQYDSNIEVRQELNVLRLGAQRAIVLNAHRNTSKQMASSIDAVPWNITQTTFPLRENKLLEQEKPQRGFLGSFYPKK